jgi:O-antigen/teichoic acid export membrane protein
MQQIHRLLRYTEKYTQIDMVYFSHGSFWLLFGYSLQLITGLLLATSFANILSKDQYGFYQFIISTASIIAAFTLTGTGTAIVRSTAQGDEGSLRRGAITTLKWSTGIACGGILLSLYYFVQGNISLSIAFALVAATQPFITSFNLYKTYLQGKQFFRDSTIIESTQRLIPFALLLLTINISPDPLILVIVYFISQAISSLGAYYFVIRKFNLQKTPNTELINYSKHLSIIESISEVANAADKALVWIFLGATPTAVYALAQFPITHLNAMFGFVRQLAFPKLVTVLPKKIKLYFIIALIVFVVYIIIAPFIFQVLFPKYIESVLLSQVLALSILTVPRSLISQTFAAHKMKRELYILNITTPIIRLGALIIGLPFFGIWGAIGAIILSEWFAAILQWQLFKKYK